MAGLRDVSLMEVTAVFAVFQVSEDGIGYHPKEVKQYNKKLGVRVDSESIWYSDSNRYKFYTRYTHQT